MPVNTATNWEVEKVVGHMREPTPSKGLKKGQLWLRVRWLGAPAESDYMMHPIEVPKTCIEQYLGEQGKTRLDQLAGVCNCPSSRSKEPKLHWQEPQPGRRSRG